MDSVTSRSQRATTREQTPEKRGWRGFWLALVPVAALVAGGPTRFERTIETTPNPRISVSNLAGPVVVKGWDRSQVHATWTSQSPRVEIDIEVLPSTPPAEKVHFTTHLLDPLVTRKEQGAEYSLEVPVGSSLEIRNPQGSVRIEKLQGDAWVESVGGSISASDVAGHLAVRSIGGDIEIIRPSGRVEVYSITGNLHFLGATSSRVRGSTTSGKILYEGDFVPGGDYVLSAYSGDMDILCPPSASFELNAKTLRGKLDTAFPITPKRHSPSPLSAGNSLFGTLNQGHATVELTSFSGTIRIRRQP